MPSNCGAGHQSLGQQGDQTSQSQRKSTLNTQWKDWCWSWNSNTLATWFEESAVWKRTWWWERWKAKGEGGGRGWDGHEVERTLGNSKGQEAWHATFHGVTQSPTWLRNWTAATKTHDKNRIMTIDFFFFALKAPFMVNKSKSKLEALRSSHCQSQISNQHLVTWHLHNKLIWPQAT